MKFLVTRNITISCLLAGASFCTHVQAMHLGLAQTNHTAPCNATAHVPAYPAHLVHNKSFSNGTLSDLTSKQALNHFALNLGQGYKTANLEVLKQLSNHKALSNLPGNIRVVIPEFAGITDRQVKSFLKQNKLDIAAEWSKLLHNVSRDDIKDFTIPQGFIEKIEALADQIKNRFDTAGQQLDDKKTTLKKLGFGQNLEDLIALCTRLKAFITTRSTGREDTEELANAGGNASNEIVDATPADVIRGMGTVVSSYFRAKSFGQRALLKDEKLYDVPLMPVLVQRVVAEMDGSPFSGCVSYTREPQGDVPGVSISQCTHGHTKGVVDSLVPLDTIVCDTTRCHVVIKHKPSRLAPVTKENKKFALDFVHNNNNIQDEPALTSEQQQALAQVLEFIELAYGKPMDLELSFDHTENILYLYQARPLVIKRSPLPPSYVLDDKNLGTALECTTMSQAGGSLRLITDKNRVIIAPTLDDALNFYLAQREQNNNFDFDLVVVNKQADATSHAAATFNGMAKPVMVTKNYDTLQEWLAGQELTLLADVQKAKLYNLKNTKFKKSSLKELNDHGVTKQGRCAYPLSQQLSIPHNTPLPAVVQLYAGLPDQAHEASLENLIEQLKSGSQDQAALALNTILSRLAKQIIIKQQQVTCPDDTFFDCVDYLDLNCPLTQTIDSLCFTKIPGEQALEHLNNLFGLALELRTDIANQLGQEPYALERLLPIAFFETLIFQKPSSDIVNNYSYNSVLEKYHKTIQFIKTKVIPLIHNKTISSTILNNQELLSFAQAGAQTAFTELVENNWISFIAQVAESFSPEQQVHLTTMLNDIVNLKMLPAWISTRFAAQTGSAQETFKTLLGEYQHDQDFLAQLKTHKELLDQTNLDAWQEDGQFNALQKSFDEQIVNWFTSPELAQIIQSPELHPFAYQAAVSTMNSLVGTFDQIIKSIKSSNKINIQIRAERFKSMVGKYLELLELWAPLVPQGIIQYHPAYNLKNYLFNLKEIFNDREALDSETLPTPNFNANNAALGSATHLMLSDITTLEDLFTTIHQSLLVVTSSLNLAVQIPQNSLPAIFKNMSDTLNSFAQLIDYTLFSTSKTGITFENNNISYHYNIPLRFHSMALTLSFSKKTTQTQIRFQFYGLFIKRWELINLYAQLMARTHNCSIHDITLNDLGISFTLSTKNLINTSILSKILEDMIDITFENTPNSLQRMMEKNINLVIEIVSKGSLSFGLNIVRAILVPHWFNSIDQSMHQQIIERSLILVSTALDNQDRNVQNTAFQVLSTLINNMINLDQPLQQNIAEKSIPLLSAALANQDRNVRQTAVRVISSLINNIKTLDQSLQQNIIEKSFNLLSIALNDQNWNIQNAAVQALSSLMQKINIFDQSFQQNIEAKYLTLISTALGDNILANF